MIDRLESLKRYADVFGKGLLLEMMPEVAGGVLVALFKKWSIDFPKVTRYVENDISLWERLSDHDREQLKVMARCVSDVDWLTSDWIIKSIKKDFPSIASLFLDDDEAHVWLEKQGEELKNLVFEE